MRFSAWPMVMLLAGTFATGSAVGSPPAGSWPQWRGPLGTGVSPDGNPPIRWSEDRNVRWKVAIPGLGHSSPIVWGDRVFVTTAVAVGGSEVQPDQHRHAEGAHDNLVPTRAMGFTVLAIERRDGSIAWTRTLRRQRPHEPTHETGSWASSSPVTDGEHLIVSFGSQGLFGLDMNGKLLWETDLGDMQVRHEHGEGSSPALYGETVVVNWDHEGQSFVVALDKRTGKPRWKKTRDEMTSWSTPLIVKVGDGNVQVVVSATGRTRGYDLATGREIWQCGGLSRNVVASPVAAGGVVYVGNSYDWKAMLAIDLGVAEGDITGKDAVLWKRARDTPYVPSPVLYDGMLMFIKHNQGFLTNVDAATGRTLFGPVRLPGLHNVFASPVGAGDRVYVVSRNGHTAVLRRGVEFEPLADNVLDDSFSASPAIAGRELYLRGERHLYCIAEDSAVPANHGQEAPLLGLPSESTPN